MTPPTITDDLQTFQTSTMHRPYSSICYSDLADLEFFMYGDLV